MVFGFMDNHNLVTYVCETPEFFGRKGEASIRAFLPDYPLSWLWEKDDCTLLNERVMHLSLCEAKEGKYDWSAFLDVHLPEAERRFQDFINRLKSEPRAFCSAHLSYSSNRANGSVHRIPVPSALLVFPLRR
jgi:hypothetical protein